MACLRLTLLRPRPGATEETQRLLEDLDEALEHQVDGAAVIALLPPGRVDDDQDRERRPRKAGLHVLTAPSPWSSGFVLWAPACISARFTCTRTMPNASASAAAGSARFGGRSRSREPARWFGPRDPHRRACSSNARAPAAARRRSPSSPPACSAPSPDRPYRTWHRPASSRSTSLWAAGIPMKVNPLMSACSPSLSPTGNVLSQPSRSHTNSRFASGMTRVISGLLLSSGFSVSASR